MGADKEDEMFDFFHLVGEHAFKLRSARHDREMALKKIKKNC